MSLQRSFENFDKNPIIYDRLSEVRDPKDKQIMVLLARIK